MSNNIAMLYVVDNEKYFQKKYHFDTVEPFSGNANYKIVHLNDFENYINYLVSTIKYL